jgi:CII-binding regulator of phage lambda lysogenization HflD
MFTRENLEKRSNTELEQLVQDLKAQYEQRISKNRRIQQILSNKLQSIEESISNLRTENEKVKSKLIAMGYPENMFKRDFDHTFLV